MSMILDPRQPIYLQIMQELKKRTVRGQYPPGGQLPSVRELAGEIGVNPNTIARVYLELEREGFIFTRRGQGSYVTSDIARIDRERELLAEEARERFLGEITGLSLTEEHLKTLMDEIRSALTDPRHTDTSHST